VGHYTIYGDLGTRQSVTLATVLHAKGVAVDFVQETASLAFALASRAGREAGPYLRTPEGFVLAELHAMLELIERVHPTPSLVPTRPVRRACARLIEDWLELWLPHWPRRSWGTLERLEAHLHSAGFLLGSRPTRADWILAGWLETEVLVHSHARSHLDRVAPRLASLGQHLLDAKQPTEVEADDALPISLLTVLEEIARDYHSYLENNHRALKDHESHVQADPNLGLRALPVQLEAEIRRVDLGAELAALDRTARKRVTEFLEPLGAWTALTWPPALEEMDPADPRSL
jgi:glutathione S-transferase